MTVRITSADGAKGTFFKVLATTDKSQVAVMTLKPGRDSGEGDIHKGDQTIYIVEGEARIVVRDEEGIAKKGDVAVIPAQSPHRIYNNANTDLFFVTFYSSPEY